MKSLYRKCPICDAGEGDVLHSMSVEPLEGITLPSLYDIVSCIKCGFIFNDTDAKQDDYDLYYASDSIYESPNTEGIGGLLDTGRFEDTIAAIAPFIAKDSSIIDIGCSQGGLLYTLGQHGYTDLHGMEVSKKNLTLLSSYGISTWNNTINDIGNISRRFDFACLTNVMEHIFDLKTAASNIRHLLNGGGYAYIEVPDVSRYCVFFQNIPFNFFNIEHINHFSTTSLANLLEASGLSVVSTIEISTPRAAFTYPVIGIVVKAVTPGAAVPGTLIKTTDAESVIEYCKKCADEMIQKNKLFDEICLSKSKIVIWGAGMYAQWLLKNSSLAKCDIACFADVASQKHGRKIGSYQIHPVELLCNSEYNNEDTVIVIASPAHKHKIEKQISDMKLKCTYYAV